MFPPPLPACSCSPTLVRAICNSDSPRPRFLAARRSSGRTLYLLDEPTTDLHLADTARLLQVLQRLVDAGNSVIVVEHNLELVKAADWIIDLGPEGGAAGGRLIAAGTPEQIAPTAASYTGQGLRNIV